MTKRTKSFSSLRFSLSLAICLMYICNCAANIQLYVGQYWDISPDIYGTVDAIAVYSDHPNDISISKGSRSATIVITQYFEGYATVECQYGYSYYSGTQKVHSTGHDYYTISCRKSTITLNKKSIEISPGEEIKLWYTNDSGYKLPYCLWETSDEKVVTVDGSYRAIGEQEVTIKGIKAGESKITLKAPTGGNGVLECKVVVKEKPLKSFSLSPTSLQIMVGQTGSFKVTKVPSDASTPIKWKSSDESIATVTSNGTIKGIKQGKTKITATSDNGIKVKGDVEIIGLPTKISLEPQYEMNVGYRYNIKPLFTPEGSSEDYKVKITNTSIVEQYSKAIFTARKTGTTKITITTNSGLKAETTIIVKPVDPKYEINKISKKISKMDSFITKAIKNIK